MNEKISKIKLELLKEEFTKQIKDSYILNLSMVVLEEFEKLQKENKQLKEENEFLKSEIEEAKRIIQKYLEYIDERDERIDKTIKYIESNNETLYTYEPDYDYEENMVDNYDISNYREDLLKILKEVE